MLFTTQQITDKDIKSIDNFFEEFENQEVVKDTPEKSSVSKYISKLVVSCYSKSVDDITNTQVGTRLVRKRNFQQIMQQSFFYGANRFGNNYIA